jgi:hypothetical protein
MQGDTLLPRVALYLESIMAIVVLIASKKEKLVMRGT